MTRIAIVDDYQNVALSLADWKSIPGAKFTVFDKPFANEDEIVEKLQGFEIVSTSAEEVSLDAAEVEPQHLAPNDAMVFHQRIRTCAPELIDAQSTVTVTVSYLDALSFEPEQVQLSRPLLELLEADQAPLLKGAAVFAYAEGLKAYKQADLGGRSATMSGALAALERAEAVLPDDPELAEIRAVLEALALR